MINNGNFPVITNEEWMIITETDESTLFQYVASEEEKNEMLENMFKKEKEEDEEENFKALHIKI